MSQPQDIQGMMKALGLPGIGGAVGPQPALPIGQTKKRLGDERVPMSAERPMRNPGQVQDQAARQLGVRPEQVQPQPRVAQAPQPPRNIPPQPPVQAPAPPTLPRSDVPLPRPRPDPEINPRAMSGIPMPQSRPVGADVAGMLGALKDGGGGPPPAMVAKVLGDKLQQQASAKPPSVFPYFDKWLPGAGSDKPQAQPGLSSAVAAPSPPSDPFSTGAPPVQAGPQQLMQVVAAAAKAKAEQNKPPVQAPDATVASPNITPPVPRGVPPPPPPAVTERETPYEPSQPNFKGYEVRPAKEKKGEEKHGEKPLKKGNSPYYYTRIGVRPGDNSGVAQRLREVREKAGNPRTARKMTEEEDRILAQYNESDAYLMSMLPADVAKRMQEYRSGNLAGQIPDRYDERPPGVTEDAGRPTPLKLPPKSQDKRVDKAEKLANDRIQNPPKRNDTDKDDEETPPDVTIKEE